MVQVFISHTKKDEKFCDEFDRICASVGIKRFRSEFEDIKKPPWKTIRDAINDSVAVFFLVGNELVKNQDYGDSGWRHTQNWIAYEIGVACQKGIDVWAICDGVSINFSMPYINNYFTDGLKHIPAFRYFKNVLDRYNEGKSFPYNIKNPSGKLGVICPYEDCKMEFNLHAKLKPKDKIKCPQCLKNMNFPGGFPSQSPCQREDELDFLDRDIF